MTNHATHSQQTTRTAQGINDLNNTEVTGRLLMLASKATYLLAVIPTRKA